MSKGMKAYIAAAILTLGLHGLGGLLGWWKPEGFARTMNVRNWNWESSGGSGGGFRGGK